MSDRLKQFHAVGDGVCGGDEDDISNIYWSQAILSKPALGLTAPDTGISIYP